MWGNQLRKKDSALFRRKVAASAAKICNSKMMVGMLRSIKAKLSTSEDNAKARIDV